MQTRTPINVDIPSSLCCPITYEPYTDPVLGNDGRVYEREAITKCVATESKSPFTRQLFWFVPAVALREQVKTIITDWKQKNHEWQEYTEQLKRDWQEHTEHLKKENTSLKNEATVLRNELKTLKKLNVLKESKEESSKNNLFFPPDSLTQSRNNCMFLEAVREANILAIKDYAKRKGVYINTRDKDNGASALIIAISLRSTHPREAKDIIMMLCDEFKIDVDIKNFRGCTALHLAASNNDVWAVNFLLSKFAYPLSKNDYGDTPRKFAYKVNNEKLDISISSALYKAELNYQTSSSSASFFSPLQPSITARLAHLVITSPVII